MAAIGDIADCEWKYCSTAQRRPLPSGHFYTRYSTEPDQFQHVWWYHRGYCENEGILTCFSDGTCRAYYRSDNEEYDNGSVGSAAGMWRGVWESWGSVLQVTAEECAVSQRSGVPDVPCATPNAWMNCKDCSQWRVPMVFEINTDGYEFDLPFFNMGKWGSTIQYYPGSRPQFGN
eukprot:TRINITY_DN2843_c0_g1_i4.p2 TRINITY_DN2843_c0_g1~~TRINITY_DN2843_c0_g1_i4.p2  ORF type:complete len:175 (-),score=28.76 TRINITY_DN2843_c0_g1_i4:108-632(-)